MRKMILLLAAVLLLSFAGALPPAQAQGTPTLLTLYVVPVMYDIFSRKELYQVAEEDLILSDK